MVDWLFVCLFAYKRGGVWQVSQGSTLQLAANKAKWDRGTGRGDTSILLTCCISHDTVHTAYGVVIKVTNHE